jgi:hypothetical protein
VDLHEIHHKEVQRMPAVLLGVASAAIGFAFHETADRVPSASLLPLLVAVLAWAGSFTAGVLYSRAYANGIRGNIALNLAEEARNPKWRDDSKAMFEKWNRKASRRYQAQQWLLLTGALMYLTGHVWHIVEQRTLSADGRQQPTTLSSRTNGTPLVSHSREKQSLRR